MKTIKIKNLVISAFILLVLAQSALAATGQDTTAVKQKKVNFIVLPMYDYRPVLEHSFALFGKAITTLDKDRLFISDLLASKSLSNPSYMIQIKNELYFQKWRFGVNMTMMKQVNQMPAVKVGIDSPDLFGTELNMGYLQAYAKRKLANRFYGGLGVEWGFMGKYQMKFSQISDANIENTELTMKMIQPMVTFEYDSRDNKVYPTKGLYITNQTNFISDAFGSTIESLGPDYKPVESKDYFFAKNIMRATLYQSLDGTWKSVLATRYGNRIGFGDVPPSLWENANNWIRGL